MSRPAGATPLGRHLYLFRSKTNSADCIISAHGGYLFDTMSFTVPKGIELRFYSPHSTALLDPGLEEFHEHLAEAVPVEVRTGGKSCRDYLLEKYQGRHNEAGETYDSIVASVRERDKGLGGASVVTIRNRWDLVVGLKLSDVVAAVRREIPTIRRFYCCFCRANVVSDSLADALKEVFGAELGGDLGMALFDVKTAPGVAISYNC